MRILRRSQRVNHSQKWLNSIDIRTPLYCARFVSCNSFRNILLLLGIKNGRDLLLAGEMVVAKFMLRCKQNYRIAYFVCAIRKGTTEKYFGTLVKKFGWHRRKYLLIANEYLKIGGQEVERAPSVMTIVFGLSSRPALAEHRRAEDDGGDGSSLCPGYARSSDCYWRPGHVAAGARWKVRRWLLYLDVRRLRSGIRPHGGLARWTPWLRQRLLSQVTIAPPTRTSKTNFYGIQLDRPLITHLRGRFKSIRTGVSLQFISLNVAFQRLRTVTPNYRVFQHFIS